MRGKCAKAVYTLILTVTLNPAVDKLYILDNLTPNAVNRVRESYTYSGGKGLNVARVAALADEEVVCVGFVGGVTGKMLETLATHPKLTSRFTHVEAQTRLCVNVRDNMGRLTEFLEPGAPITREDLERFVSDYRAQLPEASIVVLSGSLPEGVPSDFYAHLVYLAKDAGKRVIVDTSGEALAQAVMAVPTMIKPNIAEIHSLLQVDENSRQQIIEGAKSLYRRGIEIVVCSMGKDGAVVVCEGGVYHGITTEVPAINTVGCGDSMVAGFAIGMMRGYMIEDTIKYALAVSTANALTKESGSFRAKDVSWLLTKVDVKRLE